MQKSVLLAYHDGMNSRSFGRFGRDTVHRKKCRLTPLAIRPRSRWTVSGNRLARKGKPSSAALGNLIFMIAETHVPADGKEELLLLAGATTSAARNHETKSARTFGFIVRLRAALAREVPFGYQDETGFHYGVEQ